ncbi:MAG: Gfo/Idh/MocA family oxidoreductase [Acidobacteria bacterium]|nr:Gfo/Idh/MocA family oxidoreductase [Acidobacteriota bacterium]
MADPIRIGIAGAGFAARFHMKGYQRVYGVPLTITGVISSTAASGKKFAKEFGVRAFNSLEELCDASDVIDICTPGSSHEELSVEALNRGKHVIIEKPFTGY